MKYSLWIAFASILNLLLSFLSIFLSPLIFTQGVSVSSASSDYVSFYVISISSALCFLLLILLVIKDKEVGMDKRIIGLIFVFIFSGVGGFIYLFIRKSTLRYSSAFTAMSDSFQQIDNLSSLNNFERTSYSENPASSDHIDRAAKEVVRSTARAKSESSKNWDLASNGDTGIAYYKNGKPVYAPKRPGHK